MSVGPPDRVAVLGAGTMGSGIALSFARAGSTVKLSSRRGSTLQAARTRIDESLQLLVASKVLDTGDAGRAFARISTTQDLDDAVQDAELVVESVTEDLDVKHEVLARTQRAAPPETVLVTDTSSIAIDDLAAALDRPGSFAGMHWFNPPELVSLVEIVSGSRTEPEVAQRLVDWTRALGKRPVHLRRDIAGFIANRIQYAVFREAFALVKEGVCDYADVDETMKAGLGARWAAIGPFESLDLAGLDVYEAVARRLYPLLANDREPASSALELVAEGHLGCKTGRGLYGDYDDEAIAALRRRGAQVLLALERLNRS
ncbi:MAG TPA: 3-hydroxyacyl-CoA dehydrogenase family protein [Solirubrobacteraceae bacterium]